MPIDIRTQASITIDRRYLDVALGEPALKVVVRPRDEGPVRLPRAS